MGQRPVAQPVRQASLAEHYRPGLDADDLRELVDRVRESVDALSRDGAPVRYLRSTIVPRDEAFLCVVEADSEEEEVRAVYAAAQIRLERLSPAVTDEGTSSSPATTNKGGVGDV